MSDVMLLGVLRSPIPNDPAECSRIEWVQFIARAREAAARIEADAATIARLEGERDEARANADVYAGFNDAAEAKVAALVEAVIIADSALELADTLQADQFQILEKKGLNLNNVTPCKQYREARAAIAAAKEGVVRTDTAALVEALTLYASESLYDHDGNPDGMKPIERDGGQTARAILWPDRFAAAKEGA